MTLRDLMFFAFGFLSGVNTYMYYQRESAVRTAEKKAKEIEKATEELKKKDTVDAANDIIGGLK